MLYTLSNYCRNRYTAVFLIEGAIKKQSTDPTQGVNPTGKALLVWSCNSSTRIVWNRVNVPLYRIPADSTRFMTFRTLPHTLHPSHLDFLSLDVGLLLLRSGLVLSAVSKRRPDYLRPICAFRSIIMRVKTMEAHVLPGGGVISSDLLPFLLALVFIF